MNALFQRIAEIVRPEGLGSAVVAVAAMLSLIRLCLSRRRDSWRELLAPLFVLLMSGWLLAASLAGVPALRWWPVGVVALAALGVHVAVGGCVAEDQAQLAACRDWPVWVYLSAAGVIVGVFLFHDLRGYSGTMMVWEPSVLNGFGHALRDRVGVAGYASHMLLWSEGLVSNGDESFLYGTSTYALLNWCGVSLFTMRVASAVLAWMCIPAVFLAVRRLGGVFVATAAAVLLACSVPLVYYGRYGTSLSGSLLGVVVALGCCWLFLEERGGRWWVGLLCAVALFVATLGYSPARLTVLVLVCVVVGASLTRWRRLDRSQVFGLGVLITILSAVLFVQVRNGTADRFLSARGEQLFTMLKQPGSLQEYWKGSTTPSDMTAGDRLDLIRHLVAKRLSEYFSVLGQPLKGAATVEGVLGGDPPVMPFLYGPLLPFLVWGFAISLCNVRSLLHLTLLAWFVLSSVPLLLTTRVDAHRALLLLIPLTLWAAVGLREAAKVMRRANVPRFWQHVLVGALIATATFSNANVLQYPTQPSHLAGQVLSKAITSMQGPVVLGATIDQREVGEANLALLERMRRKPTDRGSLLHEAILRALEDNPSPPPDRIDELKQAIIGSTLILAPAESFEAAAVALQRRGFRVAERGPAGARFLVVSRPLVSSDLPSSPSPGSQAPLATRIPAVVRLQSGPQVLLGTLEPEKVEFGFAPPRINRSWSGDKLRTGGVEYKEGIGTHAWCRMTYPVPDTARAFQALVGLDDDVRGCSVALVSFELQDDQGRTLFDTGLIGPATPPKVIYVPLAGQRSVTLVVTEGGNGRDCDHADWVEPAFLLGEQPIQKRHARK